MTTKAELVSKFEQIETKANEILFERDEVIHTALIALLSRQNHFQLGVPGTAKSALCRVMASVIEGTERFDLLLTKQTKQEEVFGPIDFTWLEKGEVRFNFKRHFPAAHIAFLDEIFKGSGATLNQTLWILNEHKFANGGEIIDTPLITAFCASNEIPEPGSSIDALYDRLPIRHLIENIKDPKNFQRMMEGTGNFDIEPLITLDELKEAHALVDEVKVSQEIIKYLYKIRNKLNTKQINIQVSDRKWGQAVKILKASAFLRGLDEVTSADIQVLRHVLWSQTDEIDIIADVIADISNPIQKEARKLSKDIDEMLADIEKELNDVPQNSPKDQKNVSMVVVMYSTFLDDIQKALGSCNSLEDRAKESGLESPAEVRVCKGKLTSLMSKLIELVSEEKA